MWRQTFILPLPRYYPSILLIANADHATWNTWWVRQSTTLVTAYYCTNMLTFWHLNASFLSSCNQHGIVWMLSAKLTNLQSATRSACPPCVSSGTMICHGQLSLNTQTMCPLCRLNILPSRPDGLSTKRTHTFANMVYNMNICETNKSPVWDHFTCLSSMLHIMVYDNYLLDQ